jgi:RHH-type proline utilization regulon transcriptional repressor/proline dehydrogenase/delta 1-pyrroline-5-carboxylate dehydrogenase
VLGQVVLAKEEASKNGGHTWIDRSREFTAHASLVGPVLIELPAKRFFSRESYSQIELFAPVIHLTSFTNLEEAVEIFNATPYALTGGIFCQSSSESEYLMQKLRCGNLYINRSCTGARVAIEPFGGFYASGTGPKAGGVDYLRSFLETPSSHNSSVNPSAAFLLDNVEIPLNLIEWNSLGNKNPSKQFSREKIMHLMENLRPLKLVTEAEFLQIWDQFFSSDINPSSYFKRENHAIPGQNNWSSFELARENILILAHDQKWNIKDFMLLLVLLGMHRPFNVLCFGQANNDLWQNIFQLADLSGLGLATLPKRWDPLDWYKQSIILEADFDWVMADWQWCAQYAQSKLKHQSGDLKFLPKIMSPDQQSKVPLTFAAYVKLLAYERSYALNTMRHGAPLEL